MRVRSPEAIVKFWRARYCPGKDDALWNQWLALDREGRKYYDYQDLMKGNYLPSFKARALLALLVPDFSWLPFTCSHPDDKRNFVGECPGIDFSTVPLGLQRLSAEFIIAVMRKLEAEPYLYKNAPQLLSYYNHRLIALMGLLKDEADAILGHFLFFDPEQLYKEPGGYFWPTPFMSLLSNHYVLGRNGLTDGIKKEANLRIQRQIRERLQRSKADGLAMMNALARCISSVTIHCGGFPYSTDLLESQMQFLLDLPQTGDTPWLDMSQLNGILNALASPKYRETCYRLCRYTVSRDKKGLSRPSFFGQQAAEKAIIWFGKRDPGMEKVLMKALRSYIRRGQAESRKRARQEAGVEAVLSKMRVDKKAE